MTITRQEAITALQDAAGDAYAVLGVDWNPSEDDSTTGDWEAEIFDYEYSPNQGCRVIDRVVGYGTIPGHGRCAAQVEWVQS